MRKGIIFDFDGTIVDSETHWPPVAQKLLHEVTGRPWSVEEQRQFIGHGLDAQHLVLQRDHGMKHTLPEFRDAVGRYCDVVYSELAQLNPGALELFQRLEEVGIPFTIASSGHRDWIMKAMRRLEIDRFFRDGICTADDVENTKPHPDVYLLAAQAIGRSPANCVGVEDSSIGLRAIHAAEMTSIAYHTSHNTDQNLSVAHMHIHDFSQLTHERLEGLLA